MKTNRPFVAALRFALLMAALVATGMAIRALYSQVTAYDQVVMNYGNRNSLVLILDWPISHWWDCLAIFVWALLTHWVATRKDGEDETWLSICLVIGLVAGGIGGTTPTASGGLNLNLTTLLISSIAIGALIDALSATVAGLGVGLIATMFLGGVHSLVAVSYFLALAYTTGILIQLLHGRIYPQRPPVGSQTRRRIMGWLGLSDQEDSLFELLE